LLLLTDHADYKYLNPSRIAEKIRHRLSFDTRNMLVHRDWRAAGFAVNVLESGKNPAEWVTV